MTIENYAQFNVLMSPQTNNLVLSKSTGFTNLNETSIFNIFVGAFAGFDTSSSLQIQSNILIGTEANIETQSSSGNIKNSVGIGSAARIFKSDDFILGGYNRVAIGNHDPQYALHISNIYDVEYNSHLCNASILLEDIGSASDPAPATGGLFYVENKLPKYKSATLAGNIPIVPNGQGNFVSYIASLWVSTLSNVGGNTFASFTINSSDATEDSYIFLTRQSLGVVPNPSTFGEIFLSAQTNGSFTVSSTNPNDTSQVQCIIVNFYNV